MRGLIGQAILAPNRHSTQPWRFRLRDDGIDIQPDLSRHTPVVDPDDHHLFVSLGCATENFSLAAGATGWPERIGFEPAGEGAVTFRFGEAPPPVPGQPGRDGTADRRRVLADARGEDQPVQRRGHGRGLQRHAIGDEVDRLPRFHRVAGQQHPDIAGDNEQPVPAYAAQGRAGRLGNYAAQPGVRPQPQLRDFRPSPGPMDFA